MTSGGMSHGCLAGGASCRDRPCGRTAGLTAPEPKALRHFPRAAFGQICHKLHRETDRHPPLRAAACVLRSFSGGGCRAEGGLRGIRGTTVQHLAAPPGDIPSTGADSVPHPPVCGPRAPATPPLDGAHVRSAVASLPDTLHPLPDLHRSCETIPRCGYVRRAQGFGRNLVGACRRTPLHGASGTERGTATRPDLDHFL